VTQAPHVYTHPPCACWHAGDAYTCLLDGRHDMWRAGRGGGGRRVPPAANVRSAIWGPRHPLTASLTLCVCRSTSTMSWPRPCSGECWGPVRPLHTHGIHPPTAHPHCPPPPYVGITHRQLSRLQSRPQPDRFASSPPSLTPHFAPLLCVFVFVRVCMSAISPAARPTTPACRTNPT
jgi:hypothetical protein